MAFLCPRCLEVVFLYRSHRDRINCCGTSNQCILFPVAGIVWGFEYPVHLQRICQSFFGHRFAGCNQYSMADAGGASANSPTRIEHPISSIRDVNCLHLNNLGLLDFTGSHYFTEIYCPITFTVYPRLFFLLRETIMKTYMLKAANINKHLRSYWNEKFRLSVDRVIRI